MPRRYLGRKPCPFKLGELWATKSDGKGVFLLAEKKNAKGQGVTEQLAQSISKRTLQKNLALQRSAASSGILPSSISLIFRDVI